MTTVSLSYSRCGTINVIAWRWFWHRNCWHRFPTIIKNWRYKLTVICHRLVWITIASFKVTCKLDTYAFEILFMLFVSFHTVFTWTIEYILRQGSKLNVTILYKPSLNIDSISFPCYVNVECLLIFYSMECRTHFRFYLINRV